VDAQQKLRGAVAPTRDRTVAIPKDKEYGLEQEFELDIRVSSVSALPVLPATKAMGLLRLKMCRRGGSSGKSSFPLTEEMPFCGDASPTISEVFHTFHYTVIFFLFIRKACHAGN